MHIQLTYHDKKLDEDNIFFKKVFWKFIPYINGFQFCKPIVHVNETFLYKNYIGTLLVIVVQDVRNNILPIIFVVVEGDIINA